jgi:Tol biopolymer transport system component
MGQGMFHPDVVFDPDPNNDATVANIFLRNLIAPSTEMLSRDANGEGNPDRKGALLQTASLSRREVLFSSDGDYLAGGLPLITRVQMFARNWQTGSVELISARPDGQLSLWDSGNAGWSGDGRFVVFQTSATDLTGDNPLGHQQLFLRDRLARTTQRLSRPWNGGEFPTGFIFYGKPALTRDGRYILYMVGLVDGITPDDNPGVSDIYLFDRETRTTQLVTRSRNNVPVDGWAYSPDISADGRVIVYFSRASNILQGVSSTPAMYVEDRLTGELINVSATLPLPVGNFVPDVDLSEDGRTLAFGWQAGDTADPSLRRRHLIYVVELRGLEPPASSAAAVPATSARALLVIAGLLAALGLHALARRRGDAGTA